MNLIYKNGSLFNAPEGSLIAHAVNTQGVWGRGIAVEFKKRFPKSFKEYHNWCLDDQALRGCRTVVGTSFICSKENGYYVTCLATSVGFKASTDPENKILDQTENALYNLLDSVRSYGSNIREIHSNKFNSGLFGVPWEKTEAVIKKVLANYPEIIWNVWCYEE